MCTAGVPQGFPPDIPCLPPTPYDFPSMQLADGLVGGYVVALGGVSGVIRPPYTLHAPSKSGAHSGLPSLYDVRTRCPTFFPSLSKLTREASHPSSPGVVVGGLGIFLGSTFPDPGAFLPE